MACDQRHQMGITEQVPASVPTGESRAWYAVNTRCRHEKVVHRNLRERGLESFLPLQDALSQWKDRRKWVQKPLFPGYLFVRTRRSDLGQVTMTRGVAHVLGNGTAPVPVPDDQVQAVRQMVEAPYPLVQWPWLQTGKRVRVTVGPLAGLETYIVERRGNRQKCHLVVTIDLLGRSVAAEIDPRYVEVIP